LQHLSKKNRHSRNPALSLGLGPLVGGAFLWSAAMALAMGTSELYWLDSEINRYVPLVALYAFGGFCAFPISALIADKLSAGKMAQIRFSAVFVSLSVFTLGCTALFFAICFLYANDYFNVWHHGRHWPLNVTISGVSAVYQFLVMGARFFFPLGIVFLFVGSIWLARALR